MTNVKTDVKTDVKAHLKADVKAHLKAHPKADVNIQVPPPSGRINMKVGQTLGITAKRAVTFCCDIGDHFKPSITNIQLAKHSVTVCTAETAGTGTYNASDPDTPCTPPQKDKRKKVAAAHSVQITP